MEVKKLQVETASLLVVLTNFNVMNTVFSFTSETITIHVLYMIIKRVLVKSWNTLNGLTCTNKIVYGIYGRDLCLGGVNQSLKSTHSFVRDK